MLDFFRKTKNFKENFLKVLQSISINTKEPHSTISKLGRPQIGIFYSRGWNISTLFIISITMYVLSGLY